MIITLTDQETEDIIASFIIYLRSLNFNVIISDNNAIAIAAIYSDHIEPPFLDLFDETEHATIAHIIHHTFLIYIIETYPTLSLSCETTKSLPLLATGQPLSPEQIARAKEQIDRLRAIPQPAQRTPEWYAFRYNLITASNAYKALGSQALKNSLIYEKCKPTVNANEMDDYTLVPSATNPFATFKRMINTNLPTHWGQRYEPLSVAIYEKLNHTHIADFGCIAHPLYPFIGASPDGINDDPASPLYGRMLEIKNVVSREITGVPKHEYAIQMQLQMEVCDLDQCDFLENKFIEFGDANEFYDSLYQCTTMTTVQDDEIPQFHGVILQFQRAASETPTYIYHIWDPATETNPETDLDGWAQDTIRCQFDNANTDIYGHKDIRFIQKHYWRLDVYSCILVERDRTWFQNNIAHFRTLWDIVLRERIEGYEHRAPKRRDAVIQQSTTIDTFFSGPTAAEAAPANDPNIKTITYTPSGKYDSGDKYSTCMF